VDEFNIQIAKNQNWGKDHFVNAGLFLSKDGLIKHKPREKYFAVIECLLETYHPQSDKSLKSQEIE
jgi:hypothetical protein